MDLYLEKFRFAMSILAMVIAFGSGALAHWVFSPHTRRSRKAASRDGDTTHLF